MKVRASVKRICENCKLVRRHGRLLMVPPPVSPVQTGYALQPQSA